MRALHIISTDARRGAEMFAHGLVRQLGGGDLLALQPSGSALPLDVELLTPAWPSVAGARLLRRRAQEVDVVVAHGGVTFQTLPLLRTVKTPVVYRSIGDLAYWNRGRGQRLRARVNLGGCARVVTLWPGALEYVRGQLGVAGSASVCLTNAIDPSATSEDRAALRASTRVELGIADSARVVLLVGSVSWEKCPVLAAAAAESAGCDLIVLGEGPLVAQVRAVHPTAHILGPQADLRRYYACADVLVLASETEGIPAVALEAIDHGLAVVAAPVGGLPWLAEQVAASATMTLADPNDIAAFQAALALDVMTGSRLPRSFHLNEVASGWARLLESVA